MNIALWLARSAERYPQQAAIAHGTQLWCDYAEFARRAARTAHWLRTQGVQPGDRVVLFMHNAPEYLPLMWGIWWCGAVAVPVNAKLHEREAAWIAGHSEARLALVDNERASGLQQALNELNAATQVQADHAFMQQADGPQLALQPREDDDPAWLFYTSGTTGRPKGVMLTHRNLMTMGLTYFIDVDAVKPDDAIAYAAPMSHGCGIYAIPHLMAGARHVVPASGGVDPQELFALGQALGPLSTFAAPTIVKRLVDHAQSQGLELPDCAASFKTIVYGGAPMYVADIQRALHIMGPRFVQIYGQGETPMVATALSRRHLTDATHPRYLERLGSVGVAQTPVEIRVADEQGQPLPPGAVGEVLVRGDSVMAGYWRNPQATAQALRGGWLWTGDVGCLDEEGFLTLKDRSKDLLISGGSNIYPREVEEVLLTAPGVAEVAVVGAPDPEWGEVVVAFVVAQPGTPADAIPSSEDLDAHCLDRIARFKRPKRYVFVDALPKNHYGKVLKTELRNHFKGTT